MSEEIDLKPSMTELRNGFKEYLQKQGMSNVTITQSCSYAFYLWKHGTKNMFWTMITSPDFELDYKKALKHIITHDTGKEPSRQTLVLYMYHARKLRNYIFSNPTVLA